MQYEVIETSRYDEETRKFTPTRINVEFTIDELGVLATLPVNEDETYSFQRNTHARMGDLYEIAQLRTCQDRNVEMISELADKLARLQVAQAHSEEHASELRLDIERLLNRNKTLHDVNKELAATVADLTAEANDAYDEIERLCDQIVAIETTLDLDELQQAVIEAKRLDEAKQHSAWQEDVELLRAEEATIAALAELAEKNGDPTSLSEYVMAIEELTPA